MAYKGRFSPKNPKKYKGDPTKIIFRSLLERFFYSYFDTNPAIIEWESEEFCIPYLSPKDDKMHRYFPDAMITKRSGDGSIMKLLIEIKPFKETIAPKEPAPGAKKSRAYYVAKAKWAINEAKWNAAKAWCAENGATFGTLTERDAGKGYVTPCMLRRPKKTFDKIKPLAGKRHRSGRRQLQTKLPPLPDKFS